MVAPAIIAAGITAGSSILGGVLGNSSASAAARQAWQRQKTAYQHRYQWQVEDMKKAGLNPMLAFSQAPPSFGSVGAAKTSENILGDAAEAGVKGYSAHNTGKLMEEQMYLARAEGNKKIAEAEGQDMDNLIKRTSPEFVAAAKAATDLESGVGTGESSVSARRVQLEFEGKEQIIANARKDLEVKDLNIKLSNQSYDWNRDIQPLLKLEQDYINRAHAARLPELEAAADFWSSIGASGKALDMLLDIIPGGAAIATVLTKRKVMSGKTTVTRRGKGYENKSETYHYSD